MWALFFMMRTSCGVESAHWPFWMGLMKRFLNSLTEPSRFSLMKFTMQWSVGGRSHTSSGYAKWEWNRVLQSICPTRRPHIQWGCSAEASRSAPPSSASWWSSWLSTQRTLRSSRCDPRRRSPSLDLTWVEWSRSNFSIALKWLLAYYYLIWLLFDFLI